MGKLKNILMLILAASVVSVFLFVLTITLFVWGNWVLVAINVAFFGAFLLLTQFKRKLTRLPGSIYLAFIVALYAEMYGFPLTMYVFSWLVGYNGVYSLEFLLGGVIGEDLFYNVFHYFIFPASKVIMLIGILLVIFGWRKIHKSKGQLVTTGIYRYIRHPQYLGFLIVTLGMNVQWITIATLLLWPLLVILYYRLAKEEDKYSEEQFGEEFREYRRSVPMFIPRIQRKTSGS